MSHDNAWRRLPDLLEDRDEPTLLAHVSSCHECQRQLFLLSRVDRLLRDAATVRRKERRRLRRARWLRFPDRLVAVAAVTVVVLLLLFFPHSRGVRQFTLRTASGQTIGRAILTPAYAKTTSLSLVARGLPARRENVYVLWAEGGGRPATTIGRFMVDPSGTCRARFVLPGGRTWARFWIAPPGQRDAVVATT